MPGLDQSPERDVIVVDRHLTLVDANRIVRGEAVLDLSRAATERCEKAAARLAKTIAEARHVYGLTTGFGPLANRLIDPNDGARLQQNLVYHLASGIGSPLPWDAARGMVLARLMSILQGASGASLTTIHTLRRMLASSYAPLVPARGTVGASGDLTPLAHMVLCFQGSGTFLTPGGTSVPGEIALQDMGLDTLSLTQRDGLALVNGTSAMTGIAVCSTHLATQMIAWMVALSAGLLEVAAGRVEAWDPRFSDLRPHPGQAKVSDALLARLSGSTRIVRQPLAHRRLERGDIVVEAEAGQNAYSLRCVPQILGAVADCFAWHDRVVETELNAVTDNPIFPPDAEDLALHGGNFMGQHVALASDAQANASAVLAGLAERQIARLCDERLNDGLPAFLHRGTAGLNSGLMGAQVTATALVAEIRSLGPASVQSLSTNAANQDVVSMGTIAARHAAQKLQLTSQVLAILAIAVAQAISLRQEQGARGFSPAALSLKSWVQERVPEINEDRPLGGGIGTLAEHMVCTPPPPSG